ncbi:hypothetical protein L7F22_031904 [Adiantum nelumboides]|nr:hypothetical protein [Adiantum nelumboides]
MSALAARQSAGWAAGLAFVSSATSLYGGRAAPSSTAFWAAVSQAGLAGSVATALSMSAGFSSAGGATAEHLDEDLTCWEGSACNRPGNCKVNLVGGYYDAGDNVKFGLPMAFTITMLSWSVLEYGRYIASAGEIRHAREAIKWGTDYFIKAHPEPNLLWGEVGDGDTDHYCWQRPEEMTTSRQAYHISESNPGSDLAGETAAAMAAASIVFKHTNPSYSQILLSHAKQDELLWAALWLYEATADNHYLNYAIQNAHNLGGTGWAMTEFSWDVKYAGVQVLATKILLEGRGSNVQVLKQYQSQAAFYMCACLQKNYGKNVARTPGMTPIFRLKTGFA